MSDTEQVQSFNPILILIWLLQIIIVAMDYSQDGIVKWSIPVVGSFFLVQLYMLWKTNYDEMIQEQNERFNALNPIIKNTPLIIPGKTNLQNENTQSNMIDLTLSPSLLEDDEN